MKNIRKIRSPAAFTLLELTFAAGIFGVVSLILLCYLGAMSRLITRNLATNHSHQSAHMSGLTLLSQLHESGSNFVLIQPNGTTFTPVSTPTATSSQDALTNYFLSERTAGVRFRRLAGGPFKLTADTTSGQTFLQFDFSTGGTGYVPRAGDQLVLPLLSADYLLTGASAGTVSIAAPGIPYELSTASPNVTTGYFYRNSAFVVQNGELRFHPDVQGSALGPHVLVRQNVTCTKPFSLLFPSATAIQTNISQLRVTLETFDTKNSLRVASGATTLQMSIPPRYTVPPAKSY